MPIRLHRRISFAKLPHVYVTDSNIPIPQTKPRRRIILRTTPSWPQAPTRSAATVGKIVLQEFLAKTSNFSLPTLNFFSQDWQRSINCTGSGIYQTEKNNVYTNENKTLNAPWTKQGAFFSCRLQSFKPCRQKSAPFFVKILSDVPRSFVYTVVKPDAFYQFATIFQIGVTRAHCSNWVYGITWRTAFACDLDYDFEIFLHARLRKNTRIFTTADLSGMPSRKQSDRISLSSTSAIYHT